MKKTSTKLMSMQEAVSKFVANGSHISIGGFTINRNPMAAVYEIIRQGKKDLHLYAHSNGQGVDELIGAGSVARLEIAYAGSGRFAPTCIRFRKAVQNGNLKVEDYSNYQMTLRFMAGAMGLPFMPCRSGLETDIAAKWGFSKTERQNDPRLPDQKLIISKNPFGNWADTQKVVLVPAINPDVTIIHVQEADCNGLARIRGLTFADIEQAKAARSLIISCEKVVATAQLKQQPDANQIPPFCVDAVVHEPWGAYPTACFGYYDYDPSFLKSYGQQALDDEKYKQYLKTWISGHGDHKQRIGSVGRQHLETIRADQRTGYATGLKRN